jgi:hypothetical protein
MSLTPQKAVEANEALKARIRRAREVSGNNLPEDPERLEIGEALVNREEDLEAYRAICEGAAVTFLDTCSLVPTPDAITQLTEAFLPALAIMCQRGYDPNGANWKKMGWRGLIFEVGKRVDRIVFNSWVHNRYDQNNAVDAINFLGYYIRLRNKGPAFGSRGEPGLQQFFNKEDGTAHATGCTNPECTGITPQTICPGV